MKSKYFKIEEMIRCYKEYGRCTDCPLDHATRKLPNGLEDNAVALIEDVLEPVREKIGKSVIITSGFRCPVKNAKTKGSAKSSQHQQCTAADIQVSRKGYESMEEWKQANLQLAKEIIKLGRYDQLIIENVGANDLLPVWIHVSYLRRGTNRHQILKKIDGVAGYPSVTKEEVLNYKI